MVIDVRESLISVRPQFLSAADAKPNLESPFGPRWAETRREQLPGGETVTVRLGHRTDASELVHLACASAREDFRRSPEARSIAPESSASPAADQGVIFVVTITVDGSEDLIACADYRPQDTASFTEADALVRSDWKGFGIERLLERRVAEFVKARTRAPRST